MIFQSTRANAFILMLFSLLLGLSACKKEDNNDSLDNNPQGALSSHTYLSGELMETHFRGVVSNENGDPLPDVLINIGNLSTVTDSEGFWQILNASVDTERAYIKAEKDGYFTSGRVLYPLPDNFNRAFITLMSATTTGIVSSATGGEIVHNSGASVELTANSVVDEIGNPYSGDINVAMTYLDPTSDSFLDEMPGNLTALEEDGDFMALISYGMIGVELRGSGGQELQIADGSSAQITVPLPTSGSSDTPASIPLWHFDEIEGVWKEDGSAELIGNEYVGEVSHFSFWNCDIPTDYVFLEGKVLGESTGIGVQGVQILIQSAEFGTGEGYSDSEGYFGGIIPANVILTLTATDQCGTIIFYEEIGPFAEDVTLPIFQVPDNALGILEGTLIDCAGQPTQGFLTAIVFGFPESVTVEEDGTFTLAVPCAPISVVLVGYDSSYLTSSGGVQVTTIPNSTLNVGNIDVCAQVTEEYIVFSIDGGAEIALIEGIQFTLDTSSTFAYIGGYGNLDNGEYIVINFSPWDQEDLSIFTYPFAYNAYIATEGIINGFWSTADPDYPMDFVYTQYSSTPGDFINFEFDGIMGSFNGDPDISVTGYGRVQR